MGALFSSLEKTSKTIAINQLRKFPKKAIKAKQPSNSGQTQIEITYNPPIFRFLFIGETGTGKSSMIANLFKFNASSCGPDYLQIWRQGLIEVIELPGLLQTDSLENDVSSLAAFVVFLRKHFDLVIPTLIFVTARVSDNRFEGSNSNFSRVLQGVKLLLPQVTDNDFSNLVLLLSSSAVDASEVDFKISRYKLAFENIISKKDVPCLTVSSEPSLEQFKKLLIAMNNDFSPIRDFIMYLQSYPDTVSADSNDGEVSEFIPLKTFRTGDFFTLERKIKECVVLDLFPGKDVLAEEASEVGLMRESSLFLSQLCFSFLIAPNIPKGHVVTAENTVILMANGQFKYVQDCRIGEKVASFYQRAGVITKIMRLKLDPNQGMYFTKYTVVERNKYQKESGSFKQSFKKHVNNLGTLASGEGPRNHESDWCQTFIKDTRSSSEHYWVYDSKVGRFASRALKKGSATPFKCQLYAVEIDHGCGTIVADEIVISCLDSQPTMVNCIEGR